MGKQLLKFKSNPATINKLARADKPITLALDDAAQFALEQFEKTTRTWSKRPAFKLERTARTRTISTTDKRYGWIDKGTRARLIKPRRAKALRFAASFRAKTRPNIIGASSGGSGGATVFTKRVRHPGIKARNFTATINKRVEKELAKAMRRRMKEHFK